jgi:hypothetical protein
MQLGQKVQLKQSKSNRLKIAEGPIFQNNLQKIIVEQVSPPIEVKHDS